MKECFKCKIVKPLDCFYKHSQTIDGYLGKCKDCAKKDSLSNREKNIEKVREYDRLRGNRQGKDYRKTESYKLSHDMSVSRYRKNHPEKRKAHEAINNAIRNGKIKKLPCEKCGNKIAEAHHDDYSMPLNIRWLCDYHHKEFHKSKKE